MWYLCLCENQLSGVVIIICWVGQSTVESRDWSLLAGACDLPKNDWLFLSICWVFQVTQHHFSCSSGEDKSAIAANPSVCLGVPEQVRSDTELPFSCGVFFEAFPSTLSHQVPILLRENVSCNEDSRRFPLWILVVPSPPLGQAISTSSDGFSPLLCRWTVGRELRPKHLTLPDPSWLGSFSLQKEEDQHKTSEKQNLEQSISSEY